MEPIFQAVHTLEAMKKSIRRTLPFLMSMLLLAGCAGLTERELKDIFSSRPPALAMPYENPRYILQSVPDRLPFSLVVPAGGELLGTIEDTGQTSGTILLKLDQSVPDILTYFTDLLTDSAFASPGTRYNYRVFFPPEEQGATYCSERGAAILLEIFELENGSKDVRLHYTLDRDLIEQTTCSQPIAAIGDFPFPHLPAPSASSIAGGGGGGGGGGEEEQIRNGLMGYSAETVIHSDDSLYSVDSHYRNMLAAEGWTLLGQDLSEHSYTSDWDFGFYKTRSWLARLIVSAGEAPNQYRVELRAVSP